MASEEKQGIDGFIGNKPVSIKPSTYKTKKALKENLKGEIIYYAKTKDGIEVEWNERNFK